jgi:hypothetical protein
VIGLGGMGFVYRAHDPRLEQRRAQGHLRQRRLARSRPSAGRAPAAASSIIQLQL